MYDTPCLAVEGGRKMFQLINPSAHHCRLLPWFTHSLPFYLSRDTVPKRIVYPNIFIYYRYKFCCTNAGPIFNRIIEFIQSGGDGVVDDNDNNRLSKYLHIPIQIYIYIYVYTYYRPKPAEEPHQKGSANKHRTALVCVCFIYLFFLFFVGSRLILFNNHYRAGARISRTKIDIARFGFSLLM